MKPHSKAHHAVHKRMTLPWLIVLCLLTITGAIFQQDIRKIIQPAPKSAGISIASGGILQSFFTTYDPWFQNYWKQKTGQTVTIAHTYEATGDLMRSTISHEIKPDILLLSNPYEVDNVAASTHIVDEDWRSKFPHMSSPFSSSVVFVVRKGNPKHIVDWSDLTKPNISLLFSNPKICGGGRWVYTALVDVAKRSKNGNITGAHSYLADVFNNVPILYANQGDAQYAFVEQGKGDVLITYEIVAMTTRMKNPTTVDVVIPPQSVEIEFPAAIAQTYTSARGTTDVSTAYVAHLYDPAIQQLLANNNLRAHTPGIKKQTAAPLPPVLLDKREAAFSTKLEERSHLENAGFFDSLYTHGFAEEFTL